MNTQGRILILWLFPLIILWAGCQKEDPPAPPAPPKEIKKVSKTNDTQLFMHYMPWFQSEEFSGTWGIHWRMSRSNPFNVLPNGQRDIASHYYPLIGPYDSQDPDVIEYHVLLMKYAGIDGVLIDWYGTHDVADYRINRDNSNAFIQGAKSVGLGFAIVYEEFTAETVQDVLGISSIEAARQDMSYMQTTYFGAKEYIDIDEQPLLLTFGPRYFNDPSQWSSILSVLGRKPAFLPLWGASSKIGVDQVGGEFAWVDFDPNLGGLDNFYKNAGSRNLTMGSVYPGFHDYYKEGGWGDSYGFVDHKDGQTLTQTLEKAASYDLPYLQLVTWNDFGEGTMFEPTVEFEYQFLEKIQDFAGVSYGKAELELVHIYYLKRKELAGNTTAQATLDQVFEALNDLEVDTARQLLSSL